MQFLTSRVVAERLLELDSMHIRRYTQDAHRWATEQTRLVKMVADFITYGYLPAMVCWGREEFFDASAGARTCAEKIVEELLKLVPLPVE